jgi:hypothetical protein
MLVPGVATWRCCNTLGVAACCLRCVTSSLMAQLRRPAGLKVHLPSLFFVSPTSSIEYQAGERSRLSVSTTGLGVMAEMSCLSLEVTRKVVAERLYKRSCDCFAQFFSWENHRRRSQSLVATRTAGGNHWLCMPCECAVMWCGLHTPRRGVLRGWDVFIDA